jgi:uncharacterized membrane protein
MPPVRDGDVSATGPRLAIVDALRGLAIAQMVAYHLIYDLAYFGWLPYAMNREQPWVAWRSAIVFQFLFLVGISLALRAKFKPQATDFWRRWAQVAGAALSVSAGSALMFGPRFIWFGILHFVAVALLLGRPLPRFGAFNLVLGLLALILGLTVKIEAFNAAPWSALGLVTRKPQPEDYVPLLPWFGAVLLGVGAAALWQRVHWRTPAMLHDLESRPARLLRWAGRWPLTIYLLHQPLLIGALWTARRFTA